MKAIISTAAVAAPEPPNVCVVDDKHEDDSDSDNDMDYRQSVN
jgi:hypothetical protein